MAGTPQWLLDYVQAWNTHDPAAVLGFMTEDVVFNDRALGERVTGTAAVRDTINEMVATFSSDFQLEAGELSVVTDGTFAAEWTMSGSNDRADPRRGLPNTGRPFRIDGLSIGRLRDGKIAEERLYWNMAAYLVQVGLIPAPEPAVAVAQA